jgi:hypothetical protein
MNWGAATLALISWHLSSLFLRNPHRIRLTSLLVTRNLCGKRKNGSRGSDELVWWLVQNFAILSCLYAIRILWSSRPSMKSDRTLRKLLFEQAI